MPRMEPERTEAPLALTAGVEVADGLEPLGAEPLPATTVGAGDEPEPAVAVALLAVGMPAPFDGLRAPTDETMAAVETEEADAVLLDVWVAEALLELEVVTLEHDRS